MNWPAFFFFFFFSKNSISSYSWSLFSYFQAKRSNVSKQCFKLILLSYKNKQVDIKMT